MSLLEIIRDTTHSRNSVRPPRVGPKSLIARVLFLVRSNPRFAALFLLYRFFPSQVRYSLLRKTGNRLGTMNGGSSKILTDFFHAVPFVNMQFGIPYEMKGFEVSRGMRVVDVGAHHGIYSLKAAMSGAVEVLAIEPHPENFAFLLHNIAENGDVSIIPVNTAVSDRNGTTLLLESSYSGQHSIFPRASRTNATFKGSIKVDCLTLDSLLARERFDPDLIKIDCEGAELLVLKGAARVLSRKGPRRIVVEVHSDNPEPIVSFLERYRYSVRTVVYDKPMVFAVKEA